MTRTSARHFVVLAVVVAAGTPLSAQQLYRSDVSIPVAKGTPEPARISYISVKGNDTRIDIPPVMPAPTFRLEDYAALSEPQITWFMASRDTFQVRLASSVTAKAVDPRVRDLALLIERQRIERLNRTREIVVDEGVGIEALVRDPESERHRELLAHFESTASGPGIDEAYVRTQFFLHQNEIDVLTTNLKNAHDNDLEDLIQDSIRELVQTRDLIRALGQSVGSNLP